MSDGKHNGQELLNGTAWADREDGESGERVPVHYPDLTFDELPADAPLDYLAGLRDGVALILRSAGDRNPLAYITAWRRALNMEAKDLAKLEDATGISRASLDAATKTLCERYNLPRERGEEARAACAERAKAEWTKRRRRDPRKSPAADSDASTLPSEPPIKAGAVKEGAE